MMTQPHSSNNLIVNKPKIKAGVTGASEVNVGLFKSMKVNNNKYIS